MSSLCISSLWTCADGARISKLEKVSVVTVDSALTFRILMIATAWQFRITPPASISEKEVIPDMLIRALLVATIGTVCGATMFFAAYFFLLFCLWSREAIPRARAARNERYLERHGWRRNPFLDERWWQKGSTELLIPFVYMSQNRMRFKRWVKEEERMRTDG